MGKVLKKPLSLWIKNHIQHLSNSPLAEDMMHTSSTPINDPSSSIDQATHDTNLLNIELEHIYFNHKYFPPSHSNTSSTPLVSAVTYFSFDDSIVLESES